MKIEELKDFIVNKLDDLKIEDVVVFDIKNKTSLANYLIIGSGKSSKHIESSMENLKISLKDLKINIKNTSSKSNGWIVLDLMDIIIHLFTPDLRTSYNLEELWKN